MHFELGRTEESGRHGWGEHQEYLVGQLGRGLGVAKGLMCGGRRDRGSVGLR